MYAAEFRKVLGFIPVWVYLCFCLILNAVITFNAEGIGHFNKISHAALATGQHIDAEFLTTVQTLPEDDIRNELTDEAAAAHQIFADYNVSQQLTPYYTGMVRQSPWAVSLLEKKYDQVQERIDHLSAFEADMDLYAGSMTTASHRNLFGTMLWILNGEACVLAMMVCIYLFGYEHNAKTELYFNGTRTGRRLNRVKIFVSLISALIVYSALAGVSLLIYFMRWDYSGIWNANVSSQFHIIREALLTKPFITWADFTVKQYLWVVVSFSPFLVICSVLFASVLGLLIKNTYTAGLVALLVPALGLFLTATASDMKLWMVFMISLLQPVDIWLAQDVWFTEGGINAPFAWFEVKGMVIALICFTTILLISLHFADRKDVE